MSKEKESVAAAPMRLANKISRWNWEESVEKMRPLVEQWRSATVEMLRELYIAKEFFTSQKGQDLDMSWSGYCGAIGLQYQTANNWLRQMRFVPRELSETGKDALLLLDAPPKEDTTADRALMQSRVEEFLRTGNRPDGWRDDKEEVEAQRQLKNAQYEELAAGYHWNDVSSIKDYFTDAVRRSKDVAAFKLEDTGQMQAQLKVFKYIEAYLAIFGDAETRALAALNLALKTRDIANKLAEENFQLKESAADGGAQ